MTSFLLWTPHPAEGRVPLSVVIGSYETQEELDALKAEDSAQHNRSELKGFYAYASLA